MCVNTEQLGLVAEGSVGRLHAGLFAGKNGLIPPVAYLTYH